MNLDHEISCIFLVNNKKIEVKITTVVKDTCGKIIFCKTDDGLTCMIVKADQITIVDSKWVDELRKLRFFFKESRRGCGYFRCRLECKDGKKRDIQLGKIICDLESGVVNGLSMEMLYPYDGKECHHKGDRLDNRVRSLESLTKEEHGMRGHHTNNRIEISITNEGYEALLEMHIWQGGSEIWQSKLS